MKYTPRERMMAAMRLEKPDCVPVCPDTSNMIPCRLTGKPFWDVYLHRNPDLYTAYKNTVDFFGFDGWWTDYFSSVKPVLKHPLEWRSMPVTEKGGRKIQRSVLETPEGTLQKETTYYPADSPTVTEKPIKNLKESRPLWKYLFPEVTGIDPSEFIRQRKDWGERGIFGIWIPAPGFNLWLDWVEDGITQCSVLYYEEREVLDEFNAVFMKHYWELFEMALDLNPDFILTGGSGGFALQSPAIWREYAFPVVKELTRRCREADILTMIHSCGRQAEMVKWCAEETDLSCINPLEGPPMGDCDLGELKKKYGDKICLMGNLHTTDVMLFGSPPDVEAAARKAIDDAGGGGGFILSTGDQCGRDTPDDNIRSLVETARTYGKYE
jgi:uroporphyrinogen decarboxylase